MAKKVLLFYAVLAPFIMTGSFYNLIDGVILHKNPTYRVGFFSLFGFVIMPLLLIVTYIKNKCEISRDGVKIGKIDYPFSDYDFGIREKELAFKDRPLTSLLKKEYHELVIQAKNTHEIVVEKDLDIFQKDIGNIRNALPR
ncbi:hypothetical protein [Chryseobacterium herbae]|uniref:Uncharacterized protein n=1 Tax=Chryseobacterium herbae TaxID=2976476 RepID=A0ABT2ITB6_9FLAO|nr:hypothetical protein [Chryseobacterium sp. pc1-10]MCT2562073.1 hypothetical protein [Chryseobacterium sp. pc1-10]